MGAEQEASQREGVIAGSFRGGLEAVDLSGDAPPELNSEEDASSDEPSENYKKK